MSDHLLAGCGAGSCSVEKAQCKNEHENKARLTQGFYCGRGRVWAYHGILHAFVSENLFAIDEIILTPDASYPGLDGGFKQFY